MISASRRIYIWNIELNQPCLFQLRQPTHLANTVPSCSLILCGTELVLAVAACTGQLGLFCLLPVAVDNLPGSPGRERRDFLGAQLCIQACEVVKFQTGLPRSSSRALKNLGG